MTFVAGASASIMKTISEIESILDGEKLSHAGPKRKALRVKLQEALIKSSKSWYKKGFNRGHKESYKEYESSNSFPLAISYYSEREFVPESTTKAMLRSTIKKTKKVKKKSKV